jgi:hypothetical protein
MTGSLSIIIGLSIMIGVSLTIGVYLSKMTGGLSTTGAVRTGLSNTCVGLSMTGAILSLTGAVASNTVEGLTPTGTCLS